MRPTALGTDRRGFLLLGAGVGAALLSGCELNNPFSTASTPAAKAVKDLSPDAAAAVRIVVAIKSLQVDLSTIAASYPKVGVRIAPIRAMHQAHLAALEPAVPHGVDTTPPPALHPGPTSAHDALPYVRQSETVLHGQVRAAAGAAQSGPFARLLGTISAALAQQLAELGR